MDIDYNKEVLILEKKLILLKKKFKDNDITKHYENKIKEYKDRLK